MNKPDHIGEPLPIQCVGTRNVHAFLIKGGGGADESRSEETATNHDKPERVRAKFALTLSDCSHSPP